MVHRPYLLALASLVLSAVIGVDCFLLTRPSPKIQSSMESVIDNHHKTGNGGVAGHSPFPFSATTTTTRLWDGLPKTFAEVMSRPLVWVVLFNLSVAIIIKVKSIRSAWDPRLSTVLNLIFTLFPSKMDISKVSENDDSAIMEAHVKDLRKQHFDFMTNLPSVVSLPKLVNVSVERSEEQGGDVPVRLYYPSNGGDKNTKVLPWVLYCHGGGWVMGSIETHDAFCKELAARSNAVIASVEYRRAPEFKHPAQSDDCMFALRSLVSSSKAYNLDRSRVGIAGDSSGGTIAAQVALQAAKTTTTPNGDGQLPPLRLQLLLCPALDPNCETPSFKENANSFGLKAKDMKWLWRRYLPRAYWTGDDYSEANLMVANLPQNEKIAPAFIVSAEADVLRDEAEIYSTRLKENGVEVDYRCYDGAVHAFCVYAKTPLALNDAALDDAAQAIREAMI